ncbi:hypothetical protein NIES4072_70400 [Nostoc commune NIES-4072]|uniref:Ferritin/DPS domain-containing protein n=1 Tax=Nostoc commune NIES-4072 TaxID=2005467 RepID=A0A2R5G0T7_NOSCO|nr:ferritin-like domain-containing protein [Nostoc commune]BBD70673.1 hypothetical protein NIES4070_70840 [Nostoc commune HK-02]GBG23328.1 hypothetical protein NIES4072_70400 [Nostoc commune NIES-4072]
MPCSFPSPGFLTTSRLSLRLSRGAGEQGSRGEFNVPCSFPSAPLPLCPSAHPSPQACEKCGIKRPPNGVEEVPVMLSRLLEAHELIIGELRVAIDKTAANQDSGTNDLLVSQVLRTNETQVWFLAEHLVDTPLVRS